MHPCRAPTLFLLPSSVGASMGRAQAPQCVESAFRRVPIKHQREDDSGMRLSVSADFRFLNEAGCARDRKPCGSHRMRDGHFRLDAETRELNIGHDDRFV